MPSNKYRCFFILLYPENPEFEEQLETIIENAPSWAYTKHDKDVDDDNNIKKEHIHVVVYFDNPLTIEGCFRKFKDKIPTNRIEFCSSLKRGIRYLVHLDNPEKYQYPIESVVSNFDCSTYLVKKTDEGGEALEIIAMIDEGKIRNISQLLHSGKSWSVIRRNYSIFKDHIYLCNLADNFTSGQGYESLQLGIIHENDLD